jgi:hypothetical protein
MAIRQSRFAGIISVVACVRRARQQLARSKRHTDTKNLPLSREVYVLQNGAKGQT